METIYNEYTRLKKINSKQKFVVSFSGGKDSTVTAIATIEAIEKYNLEKDDFFFVYADTGYEMINLHRQAIEFLEHVKNLGFSIKVVKHDLKNDLFVKAIGQGKGFPQSMLRWCVPDLKLNPINKFFKQFDYDYVFIVGLRFGESVTRDRKIKEENSCDTQNECFVTFDNEQRILPIVQWKSCNIWDFIQFYDQAAKYPIQNLRKIYLEREELRYGCWTCTVATNSTLKTFNSINPQKYSKLLEFYNMIKNKYTFRDKNRNAWFYIAGEHTDQFKKYAKTRKWNIKSGDVIRAFKLTFEERRKLLQKAKELSDFYQKNFNLTLFVDGLFDFVEQRINELENEYIKNGMLMETKRGLIKVYTFDELLSSGIDL